MSSDQDLHCLLFDLLGYSDLKVNSADPDQMARILYAFYTFCTCIDFIVLMLTVISFILVCADDFPYSQMQILFFIDAALLPIPNSMPLR
jgi:hypothetical protein